MKCDQDAGMRILVITAVPAEREAVLRGLNGDPRFDVRAAGVGPIAAAARTARVLAASEYSLVVSAGIGGGFSGKAAIGSLVVADAIIGADLGAETQEGFCSFAELGFGSTRLEVDHDRVNQVADALLVAKLPVNIGPVLTVSTATGTAASAVKLAARVPGATAEAMEGYGVAVAAKDSDLPILEIRAISNIVGPRDRTAWRLTEALGVLETAFSVLVEVV
ncbi:MAG TPA: futalosine hydrolase [Desulfobacteria bacterium]|nr:futalosine hydrolase [Desulfobacteria bacterium]